MPIAQQIYMMMISLLYAGTTEALRKCTKMTANGKRNVIYRFADGSKLVMDGEGVKLFLPDGEPWGFTSWTNPQEPKYTHVPEGLCPPSPQITAI